MAMTKIEFANNETTVSAGTFNEFQNNIENFGNEHISFVDEQTLTEEQKTQAKENLGISDIYSTEEIATNKVWCDGKTIYRKIKFVSGTATHFEVDISDLNHENVFVNETQSIVHYGTTNVPLVRYGNATNYSCWTMTGTTLHISFGSEYAMDKNVYICLEYTKAN